MHIHEQPQRPDDPRYTESVGERVGDIVETEHGRGRIVGKDLTHSRVWRWIVEVIEPTAAAAGMVARLGGRLCYFPWEQKKHH